MHARPSLRALLFLSILGALAVPSVAGGQTLSGAALAAALQRGGYVIVMRHASSPRDLPNQKSAHEGNVKLERQLDEEGRSSATEMGLALRRMKIPIGEVLTSPTYRALETIRLAGWKNPKPYAELGDNGQGMQQVIPEAQAAWLRTHAAQAPAARTNTIIVTHVPNLTRAFPDFAAGMADGESMILAPDGKGGVTLVARVKIESWGGLEP